MSINPISPYDKIVNFITKKPIQKIIRYADKNPAIFQSATVFATCSVLRPATILVTPAKTEDMKKDRAYSSAKSMASGLTDIIFSTLLFRPLNKIIDKTTDTLTKDKRSPIYNNIKANKMYKNLLNRGLKFLTIPLIAFLNYRYIKDMVNFAMKGFKNENK